MAGRGTRRMSPLPRLTIGLPVFNGEDLVAESIEALLGQTYEDFELLISDNASTDATPDICRSYLKQDSRIRYVRQPYNIGLRNNENFLMSEARTELFKLAAHDDLYARDLIKRCVAALDKRPDVVVAHAWEARIDMSGKVTEGLAYPVAADAPRAPDRFRSMLFDGWDDYTYGVIRTTVLRRTHLFGSHHLADRTFNTELNLHGPFYLVPEWMYFRREHPERVDPYTVRSRAAYMDHNRAGGLIRLYGEYFWAYVMIIRSAPISAAEKRECLGYLASWAATRIRPVAERTLHRKALQESASLAPKLPDVCVDKVVAGRIGKDL